MRQAKLTCSSAVSRNLVILNCAFALFLSSSSLPAQQPLLTRHVSSEIAAGATQRLGLLPEDQTLKLSILLPLRNEPELDSLLSQLYDSASPLYHQWLSVQEFTERFGPTPEDYESVVAFAEANGMKVTVTPANRRLVGVESSVANINRAFHVTMSIYQHPYENRTFYTPDREPTVDLSVPLLHIAGLSNIATARSMLRYNAAPAASQTEATNGSGPGGQYYGSDMRAAYYGGTTLTGAGQSIGIYGMDYNISDIEAYFKSVGEAFNPSTVQDYSVDGTVNSCGTGCDDGEPVADITESLSMAPGVTSVIVYFGASQEEVFNEMASANAAKQLSTSELYWYSPAPGTTFDGIFKEFAAQGQNLFAASGDSGAYTSSNIPYFPTDDQYVVAVGGSDLTTTGPGGSWKSESAWIGSGGGLDTYQNYPIPSYQQLSGVIDSANQGSTTIRNIPDVAIEANTDNWYCINGKPCAGGLGGTSLAAPRWAGFLALVNEQAVNNGKPSVGFLNPTIYTIGTGTNYASDFHDITTGNNNDSGTGGYNAVTGYDLATGWGSPNGQAFIDALAGAPAGSTQSFTLSAAPGTLTVAQGGSGTSTITVTGASGFTGNVTLTATGLPSGVTATFSPNPATGSSSLTLAANSTATLGSATVTIQGVSGSLNATATLALSVQAAPSFTVGSSVTSLTIAQGSSGTATLTITGQNGFAGAVTFSATGLPSGVTATFSPNPATGNSTLTLAASSTAALGSATATIQAVSGALSQSSNIALTVSPLPTFSIALSQSSVTLAPNQTASLQVSLSSSTAYQGTVQLSCSGLPATIICSLSPTSVTLPGSGDVSTLTLTEPPLTVAYLAPKAMGIPWPIELSCCGLGILGILRARRRLKSSSKNLLMLALLLGAGLLGAAGCVQNLPQHTYTVSVTGTDANQQSHTQTFTLNATE